MRMTVGFDLDMTLIDPRPGVVEVIDALGEEAGIPLDGEYFANNMGPPLDLTLRDVGAPEARIPELVARFRELYPDIVIPATVALPGAHEALDAVRRAGGRTIVVTGKYGPNAAKHIEALDLGVDVLVGELWAAGKAVALREHGAKAYAGDHLGDVRGAIAAGVTSIAVTTGPCSREELAAAGAEVIFDSLTEFPAWFSSFGAPEPVR
ncbi:HAD family hydrolase [Amycolatopsis pithecellobii]|uniref:HAD hydrolase-like protein n=1 Tax=Amycolatopsis pithecellobii TaxID=664692 RepID=A0A6N7YXI7_9PSEU|nr:HAD family hydrolase [Amycolatopsis pithecellobii]MTD56652.1 HAD hydrolase-like protein [Amycolatopsis pithecellobii]